MLAAAAAQCPRPDNSGRKLTSAAMNAKVFRPPKRPTPMQMMNMIPESVRIADRSVTSRKCDHPGVVIEKES